MKIAFVGKGGSGKTTLSALFAGYVKQYNKVVAVFDADLNIHMPELLGFDEIPASKHLSHPDVAKDIKKRLLGKRTDVANLGAFRKTTPPSSKSNLIILKDIENSPIKDYFVKDTNVYLFAIGTYDEEEIGASCYHNNLAIFENVLSHLIDKDSYVIADMVAGVDAFANTLHAQFDLICLVVEPTKRSIEVFKHYLKLAEEAGTENSLFVIGNKVRSESDKDFIRQHIPTEKLIGFLEDSSYLAEVDKQGGALDITKLESQNIQLFEDIHKKLIDTPKDSQKRLEKLWQLHKVYVAQASITERFGDLTHQIDTSFTYEL